MISSRLIPTPEEVWRTYDPTEMRLTAPLSERMVELAGLRPGMRVLDLATGRGEPAILAARRVGPSGAVLGVDVAPRMLEMARERAAREGVSNLELRVTNAESLDAVPTAHFDATLARWGLMYMDSPVAALAAARRAMVPKGVLVAALWAEPERVSYFTLPRRALEKYSTLPPIDFNAPGTFRYADPERIERDFSSAGFSIEHIEELEVAVMEAETGAELVAWTRAFGLTRLLHELPEEAQRAWESDFVRAAEPLRRDGIVRLGGVTRIVVAR
ncbi:MAG: methyltransferase domain-containing protein [Polyangiaceae bacterium]